MNQNIITSSTEIHMSMSSLSDFGFEVMTVATAEKKPEVKDVLRLYFGPVSRLSGDRTLYIDRVPGSKYAIDGSAFKLCYGMLVLNSRPGRMRLQEVANANSGRLGIRDLKTFHIPVEAEAEDGDILSAISAGVVLQMNLDVVERILNSSHILEHPQVQQMLIAVRHLFERIRDAFVFQLYLSKYFANNEIRVVQMWQAVVARLNLNCPSEDKPMDRMIELFSKLLQEVIAKDDVLMHHLNRFKLYVPEINRLIREVRPL